MSNQNQNPGPSGSSRNSAPRRMHQHPNENAFADAAISHNLPNNPNLDPTPSPSPEAIQARQIFNTMVDDIVNPYGENEPSSPEPEILPYGEEESVEKIVSSTIVGMRMLISELCVTNNYLGRSFSNTDVIRTDLLDRAYRMNNAQVRLRNCIVTLRHRMAQEAAAAPDEYQGWANAPDEGLEQWGN